MARWPSGPYSTHRTGCYGCKRLSSADGACGTKPYPCTHYGVDLFAVDPHIWAPEAGVVVASTDGVAPPFTGYNPGVVLMRGASGVYHLFGHLATRAVAQGAQVAEGQLLGIFDAGIGHSHWEVRKAPTGPSDTNTIDPNAWYRAQGGGSPVATLLLLGALLGAGWWLARSGALRKLGS